jgi:hypothetical protein
VVLCLILFCCKSGLTASTVQHLSGLVSTIARVFNLSLHSPVSCQAITTVITLPYLNIYVEGAGVKVCKI